MTPKKSPFCHSPAFATVAAVKRAVADYYEIDPLLMTSKDRTEPTATHRQIAMFVARELTAAPTPNLATCFARKDHGTILHACSVVADLCARDPAIRADVDAIRAKLLKRGKTSDFDHEKAHAMAGYPENR